ncbi:MAG: hypothetical protein HY902_12925 [Deltaproteobacteria bacterium]|nr:hypothetical protein [Deltaproteobacteria bacterium]
MAAEQVSLAGEPTTMATAWAYFMVWGLSCAPPLDAAWLAESKASIVELATFGLSVLDALRQPATDSRPWPGQDGYCRSMSFVVAMSKRAEQEDNAKDRPARCPDASPSCEICDPRGPASWAWDYALFDAWHACVWAANARLQGRAPTDLAVFWQSIGHGPGGYPQQVAVSAVLDGDTQPVPLGLHNELAACFQKQANRLLRTGIHCLHHCRRPKTCDGTFPRPPDVISLSLQHPRSARRTLNRTFNCALRSADGTWY